MQEKIRKQLHELSDPDYRKFSQKLTPNAKNILGVRMPHLRKIAQQIIKSDWEIYLKAAPEDSFEEIILQGLVIASIRIPIDQRLLLIQQFISKIDNWAVCDIFCGALKIKPQEKAIVWEFLQPFLGDHRPFYLRFAIIMLFKFIDEEHIDIIFSIIADFHHEHRYVRLAVAWLIAECCVYFSEKTIALLETKTVDRTMQNVAIRKITESFRIDAAIKTKVKQLKKI
ncbi:MAG: DNA alkylation repair protein [Puniceicoccales bacterium]|jgi:3-methyladenine DNA glycosylase AlkD|nr:DNA alkylation repair protein [Puniceicoccales bacterium]